MLYSSVFIDRKQNETELIGDLQIKGGDLTTNQTTFNLINAVAETVNFAGAGTTVNIGSTTGTTIVKNALQANADVEIRGGDLTTNQSTLAVIVSKLFLTCGSLIALTILSRCNVIPLLGRSYEDLKIVSRNTEKFSAPIFFLMEDS